MARKEKKSESLDVRLPHSVKQRFMAEAKARGETASEAVRRFIDSYLDAPLAGENPAKKRSFLTMVRPHATKIAGMAGAVLAGAFVLTLMPTAVADEALFKAYDKNGDGRISPGEFSPNDTQIIALLDEDGSGHVTRDEFQTEVTVEETNNSVVRRGDGDPQRIIEIKRTQLEIREPNQTSLWVRRVNSVVPMDADDQTIADAFAELEVKLGEIDPPPSPPDAPEAD